MAQPSRTLGYRRITRPNLTRTSGAAEALLMPLVFGAPGNLPPAVLQDTLNAAVLNATAVLEFTGVDPDADSVNYHVQIRDSSDFSGASFGDSYGAAGGGIVHPNPTGGLNWLGVNQVDDRVGQSFTGAGGILKRIRMRFGGDVDTNGYAVIRVYQHQGTFGTSSAPLNPAAAADTPTPNWIAQSDQFPFSSTDTTTLWREFTFSGANQIRLVNGTKYVWIIDWIPVNTLYNNTIRCLIDATTVTHPGNAYNDGAAGANNGPQPTWDVPFQVDEESYLIEARSNVDPGFLNVGTPTDTDPFNSGSKVSYTTQVALSPDYTYFWRVFARDPAATNTWGGGSAIRSFTVTAATGINADLAVTCEDAALSGDGVAAVGGALDKALEDSSLSADGSVTLIGSLDAALDGSALTADGALAVSGGLAVQLEGAALTAGGSTLTAAELSAVFGDAGLSADGAALVSGWLTAALADATLEASGTTGSAAIFADLIVVCEDAIVNASCSVLVGGAVDLVGADASLAASGTAAVSGALAAQLEGTALESSATVGYAPIGASLTVTLEDTLLSAESMVVVSASLAVTLADASASIDGAVLAGGSLDMLFEDANLTAFGRVGQVTGIRLDLDARGLDLQLDDRGRGFVLKNRDRRSHGA